MPENDLNKCKSGVGKGVGGGRKRVGEGRRRVGEGRRRSKKGRRRSEKVGKGRKRSKHVGKGLKRIGNLSEQVRKFAWFFVAISMVFFESLEFFCFSESPRGPLPTPRRATESSAKSPREPCDKLQGPPRCPKFVLGWANRNGKQQEW